jgi:hypothetical protein
LHNYLVGDKTLFRQRLDAYYEQCPELFPDGYSEGYTLHEKRSSKKYNNLIIRRIKLSNGQTYSIVPSDYMPYLTGKTDEVEGGLLLRHYGVPYEVIAYVLGRDAQYWEGMEMQLGQMSLVGSLCKKVAIPRDLAADEKISFWNGQECYIGLTASKDCILGAELSLDETTEGLQAAYGVFKNEAQHCEPDYSVQSINLDGWKATNAAWRKLFPNIVIIACFLHGFLKIRDIGKQLKEQFHEVCAKIWAAYHKPTATEFKTELDNLKTWAAENITDNQRITAKINELCDKSERYEVAYQQPQAYRTSNQIDRPMNHLDRYLFQTRYFNGHRKTANLKVRAWAMIYNFMHFSKSTKSNQKCSGANSRFEQLNAFQYHQNWLHNLLIAASLNGFQQNHKKR